MLIVHYYRYVLGHAGREHVLSVIRQSFWKEDLSCVRS